MLRSFIVTVLLCALAAGQKPVSDEVAYLLPAELKLKVRDNQLEWSELEVDVQKNQLQIEKDKARQKELSDSTQLMVYQFAQDKKIDLNLWQIDAKLLKFTKKVRAAK
jgi:hypothetical protein